MAYFIHELGAHTRSVYDSLDVPKSLLFIGGALGRCSVSAIAYRPHELSDPSIQLYVLPDKRGAPSTTFTYRAGEYAWNEDGMLTLERRGAPTLVVPTEDTPGASGYITMAGGRKADVLRLVNPAPDPAAYEHSRDYLVREVLASTLARDYLPSVPGNIGSLIHSLVRPQ